MPENSTRKKKLSFAIVLQMLISIAYGAILIHMTVVIMNQRTTGWILYMMNYFPQLIIIISSVAFLFILRVRHRTHSIDSTLLPLLFSFIALESTAILPLYAEITGIMILAPNAVMIVERFAIFSAAAVFVFSAVQYYGTNASRMKLYLAITIGGALFLSLAAPLNTGSGSLASMRVFTSQYDTYLFIALIIMNLISILTYIAAMVKDRATHSLSRTSAFILLIIGNFLAISNELVTSAIAAILYVTGIVMLTVTSKNTF